MNKRNVLLLQSFSLIRPIWCLFLLLILRSPYSIHAFFGSLVSLQPKTNGHLIAASEPLKVRIRRTQDSDLKEVANMLSSAVVKESTWPWQAKMSEMFTKADIESLLRSRLEAIEEGRRHLTRVKEIEGVSDTDRLKLLWANDRLRSRIEQASQKTGEDNLWKAHNFALTPEKKWFNHLQMTATHAVSGEVLGFCEIAMLRNPQQQDEATQFSPAIANLATSALWRRRGIASRLLKAAERFVTREWRENTLGLYVEQDNEAAIALYQSCGYESQSIVPGGDLLGDMFYMSKSLPVVHHFAEK